MSEAEEILMAVLDESAKAVATMTGIKAQFVNAGWDERNAEKAVLAMFENSTVQARNAK